MFLRMTENSTAHDSAEKSRDDLLSYYLSTLPFDPYPVQEEALLAWFTSKQGILVCAPTGMGKTVIAEAAMYEALCTNRRAYYTTPLVALTDQKFTEMQRKAEAWGFSADDVGLVTGNRRINAEAKILVVVAEILLNRLLDHENFQFDDVATVVMDEFHNFAEVERGIVWEMSLALLPPHVRTLLLSATVGNAQEFRLWLDRCHARDLTIIQSDERRVPLTFQWVDDKMLDELLVDLAKGDEDARFTPSLVFCFNRDECWTIAEQLKGKKLIDEGRQSLLAYELKKHDWSEGAGPKMKQILQRGVGVHHAGVLGKYRRIVERLFQEKLLSVCVCTETLAAGINLPARSVVLPTILKGPYDNKRVIPPSGAHQMFGRAGRPQFDTQGYVFALSHEDDVKLQRWQARYDQLPENPKDAGLRKAKKALKKKKPKRRTNITYWNEDQFDKLVAAPPGKLYSKGRLPWRLLAHWLMISPDVDLLREIIGKRLMDSGRLAAEQRHLDRMLLTLWRGGYVELDPTPPTANDSVDSGDISPKDLSSEASTPQEATPAAPVLFGQSLGGEPHPPASSQDKPKALASERAQDGSSDEVESIPKYAPHFARGTDRLPLLTSFRSVDPLFGVFLIGHLGAADEGELIQATESLLQLPAPVARMVRVPPPHEMPPGPLAAGRLDSQLLKLGLVTEDELVGRLEDEDGSFLEPEERVWPLTLSDKLKRLFEYEYPAVDNVFIRPVWVAGELLEFNGNFNKFVQAKNLAKQEGIIFRHLLRLVLLWGEFAQVTPPDLEPEVWQDTLESLRARVIEACQKVDPHSTERTLQQEDK